MAYAAPPTTTIPGPSLPPPENITEQNVMHKKFPFQLSPTQIELYRSQVANLPYLLGPILDNIFLIYYGKLGKSEIFYRMITSLGGQLTQNPTSQWYWKITDNLSQHLDSFPLDPVDLKEWEKFRKASHDDRAVLMNALLVNFHRYQFFTKSKVEILFAHPNQWQFQHVGGEGLCQPRALAVGILTHLMNNSCAPWTRDIIPSTNFKCDYYMSRYSTFQSSIASVFAQWLKFFGFLTMLPTHLQQVMSDEQSYYPVLPMYSPDAKRFEASNIYYYSVHWDNIEIASIFENTASPVNIIQSARAMTSDWDPDGIRLGSLLPTPAAIALRLLHLASYDRLGEQPLPGYIDEIYHLLGLACPLWSIIKEKRLILAAEAGISQEVAEQPHLICTDTDNDWFVRVASIIQSQPWARNIVVVVGNLQNRLWESQRNRNIVQKYGDDAKYFYTVQSRASELNVVGQNGEVVQLSPTESIVLVFTPGHYNILLPTSSVTHCDSFMNPKASIPVTSFPFPVPTSYPMFQVLNFNLSDEQESQKQHHQQLQFTVLGTLSNRPNPENEYGVWRFPSGTIESIVYSLFYNTNPEVIQTNQWHIVNQSLIAEIWFDFMLIVAETQQRWEHFISEIANINLWIKTSDDIGRDNGNTLSFFQEYRQACKLWFRVTNTAIIQALNYIRQQLLRQTPLNLKQDTLEIFRLVL